MTACLVGILVVFLVTMLYTMYTFQINMLEDFYTSSVFQNLDRVAKEASQRLEDVTLDNIDYYDYQAIVDPYYSQENGEVCVLIEPSDTIVDTYGTEDFYTSMQYQEGNSATTHCSLDLTSDSQRQEIYEETKANGGEAYYEIFRLLAMNQETDNLVAVSHIVERPEGEYLVMASYTIKDLANVQDTISAQFIFLIVFVIIFTIVLAMIFSIFFVKPLKKINEEAKSLPQGVYDGDEIHTNIQEMVDINETLKESCISIKQADVARKELLSNVSHDLRTPLTMIVGYGEMMIDFDDEKTNDNIKLVVDEAKRLSNLVNDLLDLSKAELGKLDLNKEMVDLNDFLTSVYNQYRIYLENQNIKFDLELDEDIECELDDPRMRQVLYNFINNAMNYNDKEDPYIRLSTKKDGDTVTISVYDNGKGISPEDVDKIWDRYYKVDKEHKRQLIGSGIGLSLAKMILEAHGLEYGVESSLGEYSCFYFKIRAHKEVQA